MSRPKIKRNDQVVVIAGKDRGARGRVLRVLPAEGKAVVERVNLMKRHTRANPQKQVQGGILEKEAPIAISNLMLICPDSGKPTRVGRQRTADGKAVRVAKRSGATFN
ncbi:MAG: 50S ribosomal protein L24 [Acidobacteria bacterium]|jgi:large subunit ribosomal protein L24|nr:50S ribosomal protein L24 [Thermoanaerobaculia bacterium]MDI9631069.1 50S ribosomal protein L24 [Acidobacteriota bacterium]OQC41956.1 MAG: 50S ribosomal protein L24 [Acidobacteria bacterium ADurb.Bin051]MBP7812325.1 50S ribosomal protein L24 [Thermoanaerobaculia bacterium]NLN10909.1 50S ribosomal protein L24 [Acidobacteriota bacterium]